MTITLPLPDRLLSPNTKAHWAIKSKATKLARRRAKLATIDQLAQPSAPDQPFYSYTLAFFYSQNRNRDDDNAAASCKAYRDGIADALRIDDSTLHLRATTLAVDKKNPRLEITLHTTNND